MYVPPIYWLQQNRDWLLCACPIRWEFKKRGLPQPSDIYSVLLLSPLLCQANRMRSCRQTDGQQQAGGDGMKHTREFLVDHYLTHRQGKAISTATNSYFSPAAAFYHSKFYLHLMLRYPRSWGHGKDYPKYTAWMRLDTSCSQCSIHMLKMYLFVYNRHIFLLDCQHNFEKKNLTGNIFCAFTSFFSRLS